MQLSLLDAKFVLLLAAIAVCRRICPPRYYPAFVLVTSAALVGIASPPTLAVIAGVTLLYIYPAHLAWKRCARAANPKAAGIVLASSIVGLVLLLVGFKVYRGFQAPFAGGLWLHDQLVAWVGFSYFMLRAIGFLHIQSILPLKDRGPWTLLSYMLFPPTFTSGPIQKFQDFRAQLRAPEPLTGKSAGWAIYRITRGYFRKAVLAYLLDVWTKRLLGAPSLNIAGSCAALIMLYLYFYWDFAGYSDVAIGLGALMGIRVPENFRTPLLATSITEFWRHWHITLVDWFRDHVFIPLGGMNSGRRRAAAGAMLIMVLSGLWHGITAAFLMWGCWHGLLLFSEAMSGAKPMPPSMRHGAGYWSRVAWTNARVAFGALLFLPDLHTAAKVLLGFTKWT